MLLTDSRDIFLNEQNLRGNTVITIRNYSDYIGRFIDFVGNKDVDCLTIDDFNKYHFYLRNERNIREVTIKTYLTHLATFIRFLEKRGYLNNAFSFNIVIPRVEKRHIEILSNNEVKRLLSCFDKETFVGIRDYCIVVLMLDCGLRLNEVLTLKISAVNLDVSYLRVYGKGRKERIVPFFNSVKSALKNYIDERKKLSVKTDVLFLSKNQTPISREGLKSMFQRLKIYADIPRLHPHLLRHTYATNYLLYGYGDIYSLSLLLGHNDVKTTTKYVQIANYYKIMEVQKVNRSYLDNDFFKI